MVNRYNRDDDSFAIKNLIKEEERLQRLIREHGFTHNPATKKEIDRTFNGLSKAWNKLRSKAKEQVNEPQS